MYALRAGQEIAERFVSLVRLLNQPEGHGDRLPLVLVQARVVTLFNSRSIAFNTSHHA